MAYLIYCYTFSCIVFFLYYSSTVLSTFCAIILTGKGWGTIKVYLFTSLSQVYAMFLIYWIVPNALKRCLTCLDDCIY